MEIINLSTALLLGLWHYESYRYQGQIHPPQTVSNMVYEFKPDGTDRLYWELDGPGRFCERTGRYQIRGELLYDEVVEVNSANDPQCARDPDMRLGTKTETLFYFENQKLVLTLSLGSEHIDLIFAR